MTNKKLNRIIAIVTVCTLLFSINVFASTTFTKGVKTDLWTDIFFTEQSRIYPQGHGYTPGLVIPGTRNDFSIKGLSDSTSYVSLADLLSKDSQNLYFTSESSMNSYASYLADPGIRGNVYDVAEWNGFLFVLYGGPAFTNYGIFDGYDGQLYTYKYRQGETAATYQSYLYVFDVSEKNNYIDGLYAKWDIDADFKLITTNTPRMIFNSIEVTDNNIFLIADQNGKNGNNYIKNHLVMAYKNNITRDKSKIVYDVNGKVAIPPRAEQASVYNGYEYGGALSIPSEYVLGTQSVSLPRETTVGNSAVNTYKSAYINGYLIEWCDDMAMPIENRTSSANDSYIWVTDVSGKKTIGTDTYTVIGDTKAYFISTASNENPYSVGKALSQILSPGNGKSWLDFEKPVIRSLTVNGNFIYFLVTYIDGEVYKEKIFITDWTNPLKPKTVATFDDDLNIASTYYDESYEKADKEKRNRYVWNTLEARLDEGYAELYYYDGYFYVTSTYGVEIIKLNDEDGRLNPTKVKFYDFTDTNDGVDWFNYKYTENVRDANGVTIAYDRWMDYPPKVIAAGDYMYLAFGINGYDTEFKVQLSPDKTEILDYVVSGNYNSAYQNWKMHPNDIVKYGDRFYYPFDGKSLNGYPWGDSGAFCPTGVYSMDMSKGGYINVAVDTGSALSYGPRTVSGTTSGVNYLKMKVNGETVEVPLESTVKNIGKWSYTFDEPGIYDIEVVGETIKGLPVNGTKEKVNFEIADYGDIVLKADITSVYVDPETDPDNPDAGKTVVTVSPRIEGSSYTEDVQVIPVVALYYESKMLDLNFGVRYTISPGDTVQNLQEVVFKYEGQLLGTEIKTFLIDSLDTIRPLSNVVHQ